jgi:hypothetical protein
VQPHRVHHDQPFSKRSTCVSESRGKKRVGGATGRRVGVGACRRVGVERYGVGRWAWHPVSFAGDVKKSRTRTSTITRTIEERLATPTLPPTRPYADPPTRFPSRPTPTRPSGCPHADTPYADAPTLFSRRPAATIPVIASTPKITEPSIGSPKIQCAAKIARNGKINCTWLIFAMPPNARPL